MDQNLKNIIAAISLSICVVVLYSLFFLDPNKTADPSDEKNKEILEKSEAPTVTEKKEITKKISREEALKVSNRIYFENQTVRGSINLEGGMIDDLELKKYDKTLNSIEKIKLLNPILTNKGYTFNTGWATNDNISVPDTKTIWKVEGNNKLQPNNSVKIYYENKQGIRFERLISLDENYLFTIKQSLFNNSKDSFKFYPYATIKRNNIPEDLTDFYIVHEGYSIIDPSNNDLDEVDYDDVLEKDFSKKVINGVLVQGDKYWMTSILPEKGREVRFDIKYNKKYIASYIDLKGYETRPNSVIEHTVQSLLGAKEIELINEYQDNLNIKKLDLIVNFGNLYFIVKPMWYVLDYLYKFTNNFGYSIILLTVLIRLVFFPLNQYSMKSMGRMKKISPQLENLKARFKDDKTQLQKEMLKLYSENRINPAASCLPIIIMIPFFFGIYKLLLIDSAMRHAPFIWIWQDLSAKDPSSLFNLFGLLPYSVPGFLEIGILPVLMGATMHLQMRLSPQPGGGGDMAKMQKQIFMFMPLVLTVILAPFAAGLVLYWCATNVLTIIQQAIINRTIKVKDY